MTYDEGVLDGSNIEKERIILWLKEVISENNLDYREFIMKLITMIEDDVQWTDFGDEIHYPEEDELS